MPSYLPNTALTSIAVGLKIYAYAQEYHGALLEARGQLQDNDGKSNVYYAGGRNSIGVTTRWRAKKLQTGAPKLFTPLAAAAIGNIRASSHWYTIWCMMLTWR